VFDFDGTITRHDSMVPFLAASVPARRLWPAIARLSPRILAYAISVEPNWRLKEAVLTAVLGEMTVDYYEHLAVGFAAGGLPRLVRPAALSRLRWHQAMGHRIVIATASLEAYVRPWAVQQGVAVADVLGTRLEVKAGRLTGRIEGRNCYGAEKVARLEVLVADLHSSNIYAYGDSRGDRELLALARHAAYRPFRRRQPVGGSS
jgi:HAD superfamily hydrolase (TIGR01490 family)